MGYKWLPVTEDFDRSLVIKKWRMDVNIPISGNYDGALSELPNIDIKTCWNNSKPENGYAFSNRFNLGQKYFSSRYYGFTDGKWTATTTSHTTLVEGTIYEFECPVDLYWAGNYTTPWNDNIPNYMWFYVESSTFEISPSAISATYESGTTSITVTADEEMTWTASTSDSWITLTNPTGTGNGSVSVSYSVNPALQSRTGSITFTSSDGDEITVSVEQENGPALVYDHPIYRSGNLVKKMYRSGNLIYYRLNPELPCLEVAPISGSVAATGSITFTANYKTLCGRGQTQDVTNDATWSVSPSGYGSISNGVFTANNQDSASTSVTITATYSGLSDTSIVEIEEYKPYSASYFTFEVVSAGTISWKAGASATSRTIEYSKNNGTWTSITSSTAGTTFNVSAGDIIRFRGTNATYSTQSASTYSNTFAGTTANVKIYGNMMSLVYGDNFETANTFSSTYVFRSFLAFSGVVDAENLILPATALTEGCYIGMLATTKITIAPKLPATTLAKNCYWNLFLNTGTLTTPSELPATTMYESCYRAMYYGTAISTAPDLPATTLATNCYYQMFQSCTSLNYIKCLATNISATDCTRSWVNGVSSTGTFVKAASMTSWTTGPAGIPDGWTVENYSPN